MNSWSIDTEAITKIIKTAQRLKFRTLVLVTENPFETSFGLTIIKGILVKSESIAKAESMIERSKRQDKLILVHAGENSFNRSISSFPGIDILYGIHRAPKNSFDEVIARLIAKKGIILDLSLFPIIHGEEHARQNALKRYREILKFQRIFRFPISISTSAEISIDMRSPREFSALASLFGLAENELEETFSAIKRRMERPEPVRLII